MANYQGRSHYTHEVDEKYISGWNAIFGKKNNPGAVNVKIHTDAGEKDSSENGTESSTIKARK